MELVWEGDVSVDASEHLGQKLNLHGLQFAGASGSSNEHIVSFPSDTKLRFRAFVHTERVPFYLIHGSNLDVYTNDFETEERLWELLVASQISAHQSEIEDEDRNDRSGLIGEGLHQKANANRPFQSEIGILLEIESASGPISEVLLYAATEPLRSSNGESTSGLVTPPRSSSPTLPQDGLDPQSLVPRIRLLAQPLRSIASLSNFLDQPPSLSSPSQPNHGLFLSSYSEVTQPCSPPRKRPKLDTVFSAASSATRRARRAGGKSVSQLMARPRASSSASGGGGLARSLTTGSLPVGSASKSTSRPASRAGSVSGAGIAAAPPRMHRRGTSLHRVASSAHSATRPPLTISTGASGGAEPDEGADTPVQQQLHGPASASASASAMPRELEGADVTNGAHHRDATDAATPAAAVIEEEVARTNKAGLSRIVLAALRMWGHAPPSKRRDATTTTSRERGEDDAVPVPLSASLSTPLLAPVLAPMLTSESLPVSDVAIAVAVHGDGEVEGKSEAEVEDFKALYHATYSAARFALRHVLRRQLVHGDVMRAVVERVLGVFFLSGDGTGGGGIPSGAGGVQLGR